MSAERPVRLRQDEQPRVHRVKELADGLLRLLRLEKLGQLLWLDQTEGVGCLLCKPLHTHIRSRRLPRCLFRRHDQQWLAVTCSRTHCQQTDLT